MENEKLTIGLLSVKQFEKMQQLLNNLSEMERTQVFYNYLKLLKTEELPIDNSIPETRQSKRQKKKILNNKRARLTDKERKEIIESDLSAMELSKLYDRPYCTIKAILRRNKLKN